MRRGSLLYALEVLHNDGPFAHPDNYQKLNAVLRYSEGYANNGFNVRHGVRRGLERHRPDSAARGAGWQIGRYDAIDPTDGGEAHRYSLSGAWRRTTQDSSTKVNAYIIANQLDLFSNFTYFMDDPVWRPVRAARQARDRRPECEP